ncbi:DUF1853 family protein [Marinobacterium aestuarii]|uniref:DUF1853 family protein n=1 Tax=Marinobacterium aestuarii TaxID=1821621 RepID=UPI0009FF8C1B|nr:DUF1853 family protein [Marinobacterium aestuarii]
MGATLSEFILLVNLPAISNTQQRLQIQLLSEACDQRRDYLWARSAPSLMRSAAPSLYSLLTAPESLTALPGTSSRRRLGLYYEDLVATLLNDALAPEPVHRNLQCVQGGITAGEFDFLYRSAGQWFHLETAVKFYLCCGDGSALSDFVGPGRRDRLDIKWQRLQQHQLALAAHPTGKAALDRLGIESPQPQLLMPGYLFYRAGGHAVSSLLHADISAEHLRGWWLPIGELERLRSGAEHRYAVLPKLGWLAPARRADSSVMDWDGLRTHLLQHPGPTLVAQLSRLVLQGSPCWGETGRGFVMPDDWDHQSLAPRTPPAD